MNKDRNLDHDFLDLRAGGHSDRTFMGGYRLGARARLFFLAGLGALVVLAGIFVFVDDRLFSALDQWSRAERMTALVARMEKSLAVARADEKTFLRKKDPAITESFQLHLGAVTGALTRLSKMPESAPLRKHIATIRDGLAQYDQQFAKLVNSEKLLGLADNSGLSLELKNATEDLQAKFSTAGYANLAGQVARINQEGKETLLSGYKQGVGEIQKRYQTLIVFLKETKIPGKRKQVLQDLLQQHETLMLAMINARFAFAEETQRFDDLLAYLAPPISALSVFADERRDASAAKLAEARALSRTLIPASGIAVVIWLMIAGSMIFRSITSPLRDLAAAAGRLADGDRTVTLPARGNSDATGTLARALDKWLDNLIDLDQLREELDHTRARLGEVLAEAEEMDKTASAAARAALLSDETEEDAVPASGTGADGDLPPSRYQDIGALGEAAPPSDISGGPISSVSRQLASFSQYVTAAADDVERTEALLKGLDDAARQIDDMGSLVLTIRDQANLLVFQNAPREDVPDNLVILAAEDRAEEKGPREDRSSVPDADMGKRFEAIRDATDRAERITVAVRNTMADVTKMAQSIAATASMQALEATTKLLSQSEYLQHMLDDVIAKVTPGGREDKTGAGENESGEKKPKKKKNPPKKA
jgi:methyl-accepting chemotaxis protein